MSLLVVALKAAVLILMITLLVAVKMEKKPNIDCNDAFEANEMMPRSPNSAVTFDESKEEEKKSSHS